MRNAINKTFTVAALVVASTVLTLVVTPSPAGAERQAGEHGAAVTVLAAGGLEWG